MSWRVNIALAIIAAAMAGYLFFIDRDRIGTSASENRAEHVMPMFDQERLREVHFAQPGRDTTKLRFLPGKAEEETEWALIAPVQAPADTNLLRSVIGVWRHAQALRQLGDVPAADLPTLGLDHPAGTIHFVFADGSSVKLDLGGSDPVLGGRYIRVDDHNVVVVDRALADTFEHDAKFFEFKEIDASLDLEGLLAAESDAGPEADD